MGDIVVHYDPDQGGRWTSLELNGREWLWRRPDPARALVRPGDAFVDAGGLEECLPTVRGRPDHGDVWSRPWRRLDAETAAATTGQFELRRRFELTGAILIAHYRVSAQPGSRFVWAGHALLKLTERARVHLPDDTLVRLYPASGPFVTTRWPDCGGTPMGEVGPSDGTASGAIAIEQAFVSVADTGDRLHMRLESDDDLPFSIALWRNLGGYPAEDPYRSIGVEPMLGAVFDLAEARGERDAVTVPDSGLVSWRLVISGS